MVYFCNKERWNKLGRPDVDSIIYLWDKKKAKKTYFQVIGVNYGTSKGIKLTLIKKKEG